jgi:hypothetical protein
VLFRSPANCDSFRVGACLSHAVTADLVDKQLEQRGSIAEKDHIL